MNVRVLSPEGEQYELDSYVKNTLVGLALEANQGESQWEKQMGKMTRVLEGAGFDANKLKPEVLYYDTKHGKQIISLRFYYADQAV
jgi:hypothetical protein